MRLISISGLDGSGKSTQIKKIQQYFQTQGKSFCYIHLIEFSLAEKINQLITKNKKLATAQSIKNPPKTHSGKIGIFLRKIFLLIDILRFRFFFFKIQLQGKKIFILADRYFYDQVINILYLENNLSKDLPFWAKLALDYTIQPDLKIYLAITPEKIMTRKEKPEQGREYLEKKFSLYENFLPQWRFCQINADQEPNQVFEKIKIKINQCQD